MNPNVGVGVKPQRFSSAEVDACWQRAETLIGQRRFQRLVASHRADDPRTRHRLIDQLIALDDTRAGRVSWLREDAAMASIPQVDAVLGFIEEARAGATSNAWSQIRRSLAASAEYLHTVGVVQTASLLRAHHPQIEFVSASTEREPDIMLVVNDVLPLAVEVKAPRASGNRNNGWTSRRRGR